MPNRLARNNRIDLYFQKQLVASLDIKNKYDQVESWIRNNSTEHAKCNTKNGGQKKYQKRSSKKNKKKNRSKKKKIKVIIKNEYNRTLMYPQSDKYQNCRYFSDYNQA